MNQPDPRPCRELPRRVLSGAALVMVVLSLVTAATARATDVGAFDGREVGELKLEGVPDGLKGPLRSGLALTPRTQLFGVEKARLRQKLLDQDLERIRLYLAWHGYPEAKVASRLEALERGGDVRVVFRVVPGPEVTYGEVQLVSFPEDVARRARELCRTQLRRGERFSQPAVKKLRQQLVVLLKNGGYARPDVKLDVRRTEASRAAVTYTADSGPVFYFGETRIQGPPDDLVPVARRAVGITPGTTYSLDRLQKAQRDLRRLNLFRAIDIQAQQSAPDTLAPVADLSLRQLQTVEVSVGTWTDEWIRLRASWTHRNLLQRGRGLEVGGAYSPHEREVYTRTWWPVLLSSDSHTELKLSYQVQDEPNYRQDIYEAELANVFSPTEDLSLRLGLAFTDGDLKRRHDAAELDVEAVGLSTVLRGRLYYDTSDNVIDPRAGSRLGFRAEYSPPNFLSDNPFLSLRGEGARYLALTGSTVLAGRLDLGVAWPLGNADALLPSNRFFAGGASTMRGYERRRLGPVDDSNDPVGGEARALAGLEVRQELVGIFSGTVFLDSGQVWSTRSAIALGDIVTAAGVGILIGTPVGPLRFNVAYNLDTPRHGDPRTVFHFAVGHPY